MIPLALNGLTTAEVPGGQSSSEFYPSGKAPSPRLGLAKTERINVRMAIGQ